MTMMMVMNGMKPAQALGRTHIKVGRPDDKFDDERVIIFDGRWIVRSPCW